MSRVSLQIIAQLDRAALKNIREDDFNWAVREYAKRRGWLVGGAFKVGGLTRSGKWRAYADPGMPDLTFARKGDLFVSELKTEVGSPTAEQRAWIAAYLAAGHDAYIWKPRDSAKIMERLTEQQAKGD